MKKIFLLLAVLVVASTVVFANGGQQNVVRWSFWGSEGRIRNYQLTNDLYFRETGIVIAGEPAAGTNEHFDKFKTQFAGGNAADIIQLGGTFTNIDANDDPKDFLLPLDQFVRRGLLQTSYVDRAALALGTRNGILYAIPAGMNMPALVYNRSLLERVGAPLPQVSMTWAEFETWLRAVQARLPARTYAMTDNGATQSGSMFFGYWLGDKGIKQYVKAEKKSYVTTALAQQYLEMWAGWRAAGLIPPAATAADFAETNESTSSLIAGRTAVSLIWTNQLNGYQAATRDTLELIELPNAAVSNGLWSQASQMIGINKNSRNAEAAVRYLNFRVNNPEVWKIMGTDPGNPVTPQTRSAINASDPVTGKILTYMNTAGTHSGPAGDNMPNDTEWNQGLYLIYQNVAYGRRTAAQGAQDIMDLINRLVASAQ